MPRDGSGAYNLPSGNPVSTGAVISSTTHNSTESDIAAALTASIAKDGQTIPTADLPMGTNKHTNVGDASARNHYASVGQLQDGAFNTCSSVSGTNTITASLAPDITSYVAGMTIVFTPGADNTGATTLALNGLSALDVLKRDGDALVAGDLKSGVPAFLVLDSGADDFYLLNAQYADTAIINTGNQDLDGVLTTEGITVRDTGASDSVAMAHNGTDFNLTFTNTTWARFVSLGSGLIFQDGANLRLYDSTDTDYANFNHDGTDFNLNFSGTTDFNVLKGVATKFFDSSDTDYLEIRDSGTQAQISTNNNSIFFYPGGTNTFAVSSNAVTVRVGAPSYHYDSTNTDFCRMVHDGTNFDVTFNGTTDYNIGASSAVNMKLKSASTLFVYDSTTTDFIKFAHDGTDANTTFNGTTQWNISGAVNLVDNQLIRPVIKDYGLTSSTPTISSGAITFNLANGNAFQVTLSANVTGITLSNPPASGTYGECIIKFTQDGTGSRTVAGWPASVKWNGGTAPVIATTATTGVGIVSLKTWNGGTTWFGDYTQSYS